MIEGVPDQVLVGMIAVAGVLVGAVVAFAGHLMAYRLARKGRVWTSVWPEKAKAYEDLLTWAQNDHTDNAQVWVKAQIYASKEVRDIINSYLDRRAGWDDERLRRELALAIRNDLKTETRLN